MRESQTMPPRDPAAARNAAYNSSVSMPPSRLLSSENGEHYSSSEAYSGEIQVEDPSFNEKQVHSSHLVPASGILSMVLLFSHVRYQFLLVITFLFESYPLSLSLCDSPTLQSKLSNPFPVNRQYIRNEMRTIMCCPKQVRILL